MGRLTLWGINNFLDNTLFDSIVLPEDCDKNILVDTIFMESGDLYPYYQHPTYLKGNINNWFKNMLPQFEKMFLALNAEYNPIENYNRYENWTDLRDIANTGTQNTDFTSDKDSTNETDSKVDSTIDNTSNSSGTADRVDKVSAYDSADFQNSAKTDSTNTTSDTSKSVGKDETKKTDTYEENIVDNTLRTDNLKTDDDLEHTGHIHGNIGVTTSQSMVKDELELRTYDIYLKISRLFEQRFITQVY